MDRGEGDDDVGGANGDGPPPRGAVHPRRDATGTYRSGIDDLPPSTAVVLAVAAITDRDESDIEPLGSVVDPDALDALFSSRLDGTERRGGRVAFRFAGFHVTFEGDELLLEPADEG